MERPTDHHARDCIGHSEHSERERVRQTRTVVQVDGFQHEASAVNRRRKNPSSYAGAMQLRQSLEKIGDGVLHNIVGTDDVADAGTRSRPVRGGTVDRSHQLASDIRVGVPELQHEQDLRAPLWKLVASYDGVPPYIRLSRKVDLKPTPKSSKTRCRNGTKTPRSPLWTFNP